MSTTTRKLQSSLDKGNFDERVRLLSLEEKTRKALISSRGRIFLLCLLFLFGFFFIGIRAVELSLGTVSENSIETVEKTGTGRIDIVDRKGELLATTLKTYSLFANPKKIWSAEETVQAILSVLPELDDKELKTKLLSNRSFVWIARNLTPKQRQAIFLLGMPGLKFRIEPKRIYPRGRLASHVLGWTDIDLKGIAGIERFFDADLRVSSLGKHSSALALSIDMSVQFSLDQALRVGLKKFQAKGAAGLVMDVTTGEVLGLVSLPDFDPNSLSASSGAERMNRATLSLYEMGSTFKVYTAALALETGSSRPSDIFDVVRPMKVSGYIIHDLHPSAYPMTMEEILVHSSNKGSAQLAFKSGIREQKDFLKRLGLLERAPIELSESAKPLLPRSWNLLETATISYGHGISVSLIAHAAAIAACVNGGEYIKPTLLKRQISHAYGHHRVLSAATSSSLVKIMRKIVEEGTGRNANIPGYEVIGKTGSAEKPGIGGYEKKKLISSFIGVFPARKPKYLVIALYDEPQPTAETRGQITAGWNAVPTVRTIIERIAPVLGIKREFKTRNAILETGFRQGEKE